MKKTPPKWQLTAAELSLNGLAEVLQQMKATGGLPRLRRDLTRSLRIEASTVAADRPTTLQATMIVP